MRFIIFQHYVYLFVFKCIANYQLYLINTLIKKQSKAIGGVNINPFNRFSNYSEFENFSFSHLSFIFFKNTTFYINYKNLIFSRFNIYKNISIYLYPEKFLTWFEIDPNSHYSFYSTLGKFDCLSTEIELSANSIKSDVIGLISVKKKFGFFKKKSRLNHTHMYRLHFLKNLSFSKFDIHQELETSDKSRDDDFNNRFTDLRSGLFKTLYNNRKILKKFLLFKDFIQKKTTKIFSKIIKSDVIGFSHFMEFSLANVLVRVKFFTTFKESLFFIKNKKVYVNGVRVTNPLFQINKGDIIQVILRKSFFDFFKYTNENYINSINVLKHIIWKNHRLRNNLYKQPYDRVPDWISDLMYLYDDIPLYFDIDYSIMSCCLLYKPLNINSFKSLPLMSINVFMLRSYNWKYLT